MNRSLLPFIALSLALTFPAMAEAVKRANISVGDLARAIDEADAASVPYRRKKISSSDIRAVRCIGPDEEPTEFECTWRQHSRQGWVVRKTRIAIDGHGYHVLD